MKQLAQRLLDEKRIKATEMIGKKLEVQVSQKAVSIDENNKTAIFVMSTSNIDRHGDVIDQNSWILKYFEQNPYFALQHRSDDFPIGKWLKVWLEIDPEVQGEMRLMGQAQFSVDIDENAKRAWDHVVAGNMNMVSVGFIPHRVEYDEVRDAFVLYDCELLECSLVGIGSNRQALVKAPTETPREDMIEVKEVLDIKIKSLDNVNVIAHLKARESLNKAIRRMKWI